MIERRQICQIISSLYHLSPKFYIYFISQILHTNPQFYLSPSHTDRYALTTSIFQSFIFQILHPHRIDRMNQFFNNRKKGFWNSFAEVQRTFGIRESNIVGFSLLPHERRLLRNISDGAFSSPSDTSIPIPHLNALYI